MVEKEKKGDHSLSPALCWTGGKTRLKNRIIKYIPEHKTYVEPFVGGGSVFFKKPLAEKNAINDKDKDLINFYKKLRNTNCKNLGKCNLPKNETQFKKAIANKKTSVCAYLGVNKRSYSCKGEKFFIVRGDCSGGSCEKSNLNNFKKSCNKYQEKLRKTQITNEDYRKTFKKNDSKNTFTYMDPPYVDTYDYGQEKVNPEDVCKLAKNAKGKVMISYNDNPRVRKACKGLKIRKVDTSYTIQKSQTGGDKKVQELLITNY